MKQESCLILPALLDVNNAKLQYDAVMYVFTNNAILVLTHYAQKLNSVILAIRPEAVGPPFTCQGSDAILKCQVQTAVWWKNGRMVENSTKHTIIFNASTTNLVVHDVSEDEDNGAQFWCSDSDSINSNSVALNVTGEDCIYGMHILV